MFFFSSLRLANYKLFFAQTSNGVKLSIYSLKKILFQGEAKLLNCKTAVGEITVLDNHETYIGVLKSGVAKVIDKKDQEYFFEITSGFLEVREGNEVRCIVDAH